MSVSLHTMQITKLQILMINELIKMFNLITVNNFELHKSFN